MTGFSLRWFTAPPDEISSRHVRFSCRRLHHYAGRCYPRVVKHELHTVMQRSVNDVGELGVCDFRLSAKRRQLEAVITRIYSGLVIDELNILRIKPWENRQEFLVVTKEVVEVVPNQLP